MESRAKMSLKDKLFEDLKQALRQGDETRKAAIRMVRAAITNAEIDKQRELSDQEVQALVSKEIKQRQEAIELFKQGKRQDLVDEETAQIQALVGYLPQQMTQTEIEATVRQVIAELGATGPAQMGQVMRVLMDQLKGKADGKLINQVVKNLLADRA
jgi:uncharacterized protein